jgi:hypothetical protein
VSSEALAAYLAFGLSCILLILRLVDDRIGYVHLRMGVEYREDLALIRTSISNESIHAKNLRKVFLLVGPEEEDPVDTFNAIVTSSTSQGPACCAVRFEWFDLPRVLTDGSQRRLIVPLDYYFEENDNIGNEELSCETPLEWARLGPGRRYAVRFYTFGHRPWRTRLHRKIHAIIVAPGRIANGVVYPPAPARATCFRGGRCSRR